MTQVALVMLGQHSVPVARRLVAALPEARMYGLASRTTDVDVHFSDFGDTLRRLFTDGTTIVGFCAAGILIRTLAPLLTDKWHEPPVLAVAEDGSAVVPLLGGLQGVNDLARQIADMLQVTPAITTTGDIRFRTALLAPPAGYHLANRDNAKTFLADLLAGAAVTLQGEASWLRDSQLPFTSQAPLTIRVTERAVLPTAHCLVYHPATVALGIHRQTASGEECDIGLQVVQHLLTQADIAPASVMGVFVRDDAAEDPMVHAVAQSLKVPMRFFTPADLSSQPPQSADQAEDHPVTRPAAVLALTAVGQGGRLVPLPNTLSSQPYDYALAIAPHPVDATTLGHGRGWLAIVGTGPGALQWLSPEVKDVLQAATDWVGYTTYLNLAEPLRQGQQLHASDNREELVRARMALDLAAEGRAVALISSGDPGIYAMAAAVFEVLERDNLPAWQRLEIQVCPGISAMQAAAAHVGAPLGHDFCAISLSDILKPWPVIAQRLSAAAQADFVMALYNPVSKQRTWQLEKARDIVLQWRAPHTPVIIARNLGRPGQMVHVKALDQLRAEDADMRSILILGSSQTRLIPRRGGLPWVYTSRRYTGAP